MGQVIDAPGRIHSKEYGATEEERNVVALANEIYDHNKSTRQSDFNAHADNELVRIEGKVDDNREEINRKQFEAGAVEIDPYPIDGSENLVRSAAIYEAYHNQVYLDQDDQHGVSADFDPEADTVHNKAQVLSENQKSVSRANIGAVKFATINLSQIDTLYSTDLRVAGDINRYLVINNNNYVVGVLDLISDTMGHVITQVLTTHSEYDDENGTLNWNSHNDSIIYQIYRSIKVSGGNLPDSNWTRWKYINDSLLTPISAGLNNVISKVSNLEGNGYLYAGVAVPTTNPGTPSSKVFYIAKESGTYTNFNSLEVTSGINIIKYDGSTWSVDQVIGIDTEPVAGSTKLVESGGVEQLFDSQYDDSFFDLALSDEDGYEIARFNEGHIKTKNFDSSANATASSRGLMSAEDKIKLEADHTKLVTIEEGAEVNDVTINNESNNDLSIEDESGNAIVYFKNGHIKTKNFDSYSQSDKLATIEEGAEVNDTNTDNDDNFDFGIVDEEDNIILRVDGGHINTKRFSSKDIIDRVSVLESNIPSINASNYQGRDISTFAKIACIGDSLTEGAFNYLQNGGFGNNTKASALGRPYSYPQYLAKLTGCEVTNFGKSGLSSTGWYDYYTTGEGAGTDFSGYDCAIIQLGVNDDESTLSTVSKAAFDNIINKLQTANTGIKIFVAGIINAKMYKAASQGETYYNKDQWIRNYYNTYYANNNQVFFVDHVAYGHLRDLPNVQHGGSYPVDNYNEGHLSAYGYWRLAQDYVSIISYIMHSDISGYFRKIQFIGTNYECY